MGIIRLLMTILAICFVAFFLSGSFMAEGVMQGNVIQCGRSRPVRMLTSQGRLVSWGAFEFRPGRVYWRVMVR